MSKMPVSQVATTGRASRSRHKHRLSPTLTLRGWTSHWCHESRRSQACNGWCSALCVCVLTPAKFIPVQQDGCWQSCGRGVVEAQHFWNATCLEKSSVEAHRLNLGTPSGALSLTKILHSLWVWSHHMLFKIMFSCKGQQLHPEHPAHLGQSLGVQQNTIPPCIQ